MIDFSIVLYDHQGFVQLSYLAGEVKNGGLCCWQMSVHLLLTLWFSTLSVPVQILPLIPYLSSISFHLPSFLTIACSFNALDKISSDFWVQFSEISHNTPRHKSWNYYLLLHGWVYPIEIQLMDWAYNPTISTKVDSYILGTEHKFIARLFQFLSC
jgi:hypothetical protein